MNKTVLIHLEAGATDILTPDGVFVIHCGTPVLKTGSYQVEYNTNQVFVVSLTWSDIVMTEVLYHTVIYYAKDRSQMCLGVDLARRMDIYQGSLTGLGFCEVDLICTAGEAGDFAQELRLAGVECRVIQEADAPRRPENWMVPVYRPNWANDNKPKN